MWVVFLNRRYLLNKEFPSSPLDNPALSSSPSFLMFTKGIRMNCLSITPKVTNSLIGIALPKGAQTCQKQKEEIIPKTLADLDKFRGDYRVSINTIILFEVYNIFYGEQAKAIHLKYFLCEPMRKPYEHALQMKLMLGDDILEDSTPLANLDFDQLRPLYVLFS